MQFCCFCNLLGLGKLLDYCRGTVSPSLHRFPDFNISQCGFEVHVLFFFFYFNGQIKIEKGNFHSSESLDLKLKEDVSRDSLRIRDFFKYITYKHARKWDLPVSDISHSRENANQSPCQQWEMFKKFFF